MECKKMKKMLKPLIPKPHPHAEREVIITLNATVTDAAATADQALQTINTTIEGSSDITQPPLILVYITSNNRLVLITNRTTQACTYEPFLQIIANAASSLNPVKTRINEC
jgi:hypothetical protein